MSEVVQVQDITKTYGKKGEKQYQALKGISFDVARGEFVGIMGASGSGKTTLLNILSTLDQPTTGNVYINGRDITGLNRNQMADFRGQEIGFIFQDFNLLENLTNRENIALPLSLQNVKTSAINPKVDKIAKRLGIDHILNKYPAEISGGQKQRVAVAVSMICGKDLLVFDEPTSGLDFDSMTQVAGLIQRLSDMGKVIFIVTHDFEFVCRTCSRVLHFDEGEMPDDVPVTMDALPKLRELFSVSEGKER